MSTFLRYLLVAVTFATMLGCDTRPAERAVRGAPAVRAAAGGMCDEHGVPQALCTSCNPALATVFKAKGDWCDEHEFPKSVCPVCNPQTAAPDLDEPVVEEKPTVGAIEGRVVRFRTPDIEGAAGIATVPAVAAETADEIACSARIEFNRNAVADIRAIVPGIVRKVHAELGAAVEKGAPLFELESTRVGDIHASLGTARERVKTAEANLARQRELRAGDIASTRQVELAAQELAAARSEAQSAESTLRMAGAGRGAASGRFVVTAPIAGTVVRRPAVIGVLATEETSLATVADTSTMWALCEVPEASASRVRLGQVMQLHTGDEQRPSGEIMWVAAEVDARTRTVAARADVANTDGALRANQFIEARILIGAPKQAVTVPRASVQRVEGREVVFVRSSPGTYLPKVVQRYGDGDPVAVVGAIQAGDEIVTDGAVLLRTEVMPGSIGAGCCEVE